MLYNSILRRNLRTHITLILVFAITVVSTHIALAADSKYEVELVVTQGKKSVETDAVLAFSDKTFSVVPDKASMKSSAKEFVFADLKTADYSYAKNRCSPAAERSQRQFC